MLFVADDTTLPEASCTATCTAGVMAVATAMVIGCVTNTSFVAAPGAIAKLALVAAGNDPEVAVSV
jgi:hypothetical protein